MDKKNTVSEDPFVVQADPVIKGLVKGYLENRRKDLVTLAQALTEQDFKLLRRLGHDLKGSGGAYGLPPISTIGAEIENAALAQDVAKIRDAAGTLAAFLDRVVVPA